MRQVYYLAVINIHRVDSCQHCNYIPKEGESLAKNVKDFIWKMGGQQGEGIESCGEIMATILAKEGYSLYSQRLFASRIKGGHTTFALRVALEQVMSIGEGVDFLLALDQETVDMHGVEVRDGGYIICDSKVKPDFSKFEGSKVNCLSLPISETAMKQGSLLMRNIVALGCP